MSLIYRSVKGSKLTSAEVDGNFSTLSSSLSNISSSLSNVSSSLSNVSSVLNSVSSSLSNTSSSLIVTNSVLSAVSSAVGGGGSGGYVSKYKTTIPTWVAGTTRTSIAVGSYTIPNTLVISDNYKIPVRIIITVKQTTNNNTATFMYQGVFSLSQRGYNTVAGGVTLNIHLPSFDVVASSGGGGGIGAITPVYNSEFVLQNQALVGSNLVGDIVLLAGGNGGGGIWDNYVDIEWGETPPEITVITN